MNILVLSGCMRKGGNTNFMVNDIIPKMLLIIFKIMMKRKNVNTIFCEFEQYVN